MPPKSLNYRPASAVRFVRTPEGGALGELAATNSTDGYVAFKVKTNAAERYIVRPHIGVIPPRATASISIHVKPDQMIHFLDVLREQRGSGRPSTAFLIVEWPLAPEALAAVRARFESAQLQLEDLVNATMQPGTAPDRKSSGSGTALMSEIWKSNESAYKGVMSPSKFTVLLEEEAIPEDGVLNVSGLGGGMGAESRTPGDEGHRSMSEDGGGGDSGGSGRALPAAQPQGTGFSAAAGSSGASEGAAARTPVRASARGQASGVAESASTMSPGDAAGGVAQGSAGGSQFVGAGSAAASGGSFNKQQVEREVLELRRKVVELERLGLQTMSERQAMAKAIETKEMDLTAALSRLQALQEEVTAARTVSGSVRMRRSGIAATGTEADKQRSAQGTEEEEDDNTLKGTEPGGFPLWQLLLLAVLMFLLGRLSVTWVPAGSQGVA